MLRQKLEALLANSLDKEVTAVDTDWFGSFLVAGMLAWEGLGHPEIALYAERWLTHHLEYDATLTDEEFYTQSQAPRSRLLRGYTLPLTTYAGYFGMSYACKALHRSTGNEAAKKICCDIGDIILHQCARNNLGLIAHDDSVKAFTIPDVAYFVVAPLFIAASFQTDQASAYAHQAALQLEGFVDLFFDVEKRLTKTIYQDGALGKTYWIRASGWLLWTICEAMPYLDPGSRLFDKMGGVLRQMAEGFRDYQDASGAFRLLINESDTPLETTGTIMIAHGILDAVWQGWLPAEYSSIPHKAWPYIDTKLDHTGALSGCYSGWAVPAENRILDFDRPMNWMPGMLLKAGALCLT